MIIESLKYVDEVFIEESLEQKANYCKRYNADVLIMGDDHSGKFDWVKEEIETIEIIYLPRTKDVSSTSIKQFIIVL